MRDITLYFSIYRAWIRVVLIWYNEIGFQIDIEYICVVICTHIITYFRSSFIASMGSAIASTPIDVVRVSITKKYFTICIFYLNDIITDTFNESKEDTYHRWHITTSYL